MIYSMRRVFVSQDMDADFARDGAVFQEKELQGKLENLVHSKGGCFNAAYAKANLRAQRFNKVRDSQLPLAHLFLAVSATRASILSRSCRE